MVARVYPLMPPMITERASREWSNKGWAAGGSQRLYKKRAHLRSTFWQRGGMKRTFRKHRTQATILEALAPELSRSSLDARRAREFALIVQHLEDGGGYAYHPLREGEYAGTRRTFGLRIAAGPLEFQLTLASDILEDFQRGYTMLRRAYPHPEVLIDALAGRLPVPDVTPLVIVRRADGRIPNLPTRWKVTAHEDYVAVQARDLGWPWYTWAQLRRLRRAIREALLCDARRPPGR